MNQSSQVAVGTEGAAAGARGRAPAASGERETSWQAWHLHLGTSAVSAHDRVVTEVVGPVLAAVPGKPWFFLRYWQGGPHVRLRLGDLDEAQTARVEKLLADGLADAGRPRDGEEPVRRDEYAQTAARMEAAGDEPSHEEVTGLLEPGVHRFAYHPEYERYGGRDLMPATERLFQLSSELCLAFLRRGPSTGARSMLALRAGYFAGRALGDTEDEAAYAFHGLRAWRAWAAGFGYSEQQLDQVCRAPGAVSVPDEPGPLAHWHGALTALAAEVRRGTGLHPGQVVSSHVHMLHNRLGLRVIEELRTYALLNRLLDGPAPSEPADPSQRSRPYSEEQQ